MRLQKEIPWPVQVVDFLLRQPWLLNHDCDPMPVSEPCSFLFETIVVSNQTLGLSKQNLLVVKPVQVVVEPVHVVLEPDVRLGGRQVHVNSYYLAEI